MPSKYLHPQSRYYYQYSESRLSTCVLTIHGLLHVVDDIKNCGPSWTTWTFFMERFCGSLKRALRSKRYPWANLSKRALHISWRNQLAYRYDLKEELSEPNNCYRDSDDLTRNEKRYKNCEYSSGSTQDVVDCRLMSDMLQLDPDHVMVTPFEESFQLDTELLRQVAYYWHIVTETGQTVLEGLLPKVMPVWGKMRIEGLRVTIQTARNRARNNTGRNSSFVRV